MNTLSLYIKAHFCKSSTSAVKLAMKNPSVRNYDFARDLLKEKIRNTPIRKKINNTEVSISGKDTKYKLLLEKITCIKNQGNSGGQKEIKGIYNNLNKTLDVKNKSEEMSESCPFRPITGMTQTTSEVSSMDPNKTNLSKIGLNKFNQNKFNFTNIATKNLSRNANTPDTSLNHLDNSCSVPYNPRSIGNLHNPLKIDNGLFSKLSERDTMRVIDEITSKSLNTLEQVENELKQRKLGQEDLKKISSHFRFLRPFSGADKPSKEMISKYAHRTESELKVENFIASRENFSHILLKFIGNEDLCVMSKSLNSKNFFINSYKKDEWIFKSNYRNEKSEPYFASDIAKFQYRFVAENNGFLGVMPKKILRKEVINKITVDATRGFSGDELFKIFFEETPNGKSTKQILKAFNLKATSVTYIYKCKGEDGPSFCVDVVPEVMPH